MEKLFLPNFLKAIFIFSKNFTIDTSLFGSITF